MSEENAATPEAALEAQAPQVLQEGSGSAEVTSDGLDLVIDVPLRLTVELGTSRMLLRDVLQLGKGSVVDLDRHPNDPVDILVNGRLIARGDLASDDERLAVRIVELVQDGGTRR